MKGNTVETQTVRRSKDSENKIQAKVWFVNLVGRNMLIESAIDERIIT